MVRLGDEAGEIQCRRSEVSDFPGPLLTKVEKSFFAGFGIQFQLRNGWRQGKRNVPRHQALEIKNQAAAAGLTGSPSYSLQGKTKAG
ncbi:MAG TPA: hypothetical protein DG577_02590 [Firmicutes bacterium]|nr:hypothetical protein [Bacillota bacterium]HBS92493.1 hypothetical protein [Bacillota bacterium]HCX78280.1 hypothetical protein [Bacillota bacterium]